ncbi:MAG TPA: KUP/HAK/KT family potassium transporter [Opitutaceae bacterium]|nr:KUP/HAK/KT family potassium transporter [Opitutaceae bacterium]
MSLPPRHRGARAALVLGALGVVFGDIGTSPLYTMKECLIRLPAGDSGDNILGVLSLMFWSLVIVVCVKYLLCVMRADNQGEGGIFALLGLLQAGRDSDRRSGTGAMTLLILVGAALLYGDGIITPAISVLGAAEGLTAVDPGAQRFVPWLAAAVLAVLFWFQHHGTHRIGGIFGPLMITWFATLALLGGWQVAQHPEVAAALNPLRGWLLLCRHPREISALLGAVVLVVTGAEALYADMGHFGRGPIALAWYGGAFPGLVLNYFGQGAWLLAHPGASENPFFALAPPGLGRALLTALSILAAIVASQALISGSYSLTRQAIQLGYFPRLKVSHTNPDQPGQIYLPLVNTVLGLGCILTVALFGSTDRLAAAYGIAVTGTMAITTIAYFCVTRRLRWPLALTLPVCAIFLFVDLAFLGANARKISEGGWFPLAIGAVVFAIMHTWNTGRREIFHRLYQQRVTDTELFGIIHSPHLKRVPGVAVFMVSSPKGPPIALLHHVKANRCLHRTVVLLSILTDDLPAVPPEERLLTFELGDGLWRVVGRYGYMESPDVGALLGEARRRHVPVEASRAVYFFNREMIITGGSAPMWEWQKRLYAFLSRNARSAKDYYQITPTQIVELGLPIHL